MKITHHTPLRIGFVKLTDAAPFIVAKELGMYEKFGLTVELLAQNSWSTLRDKLEMGLLDAAQMLAPMPLANQVGMSGNRKDIIIPMITSQNGNGVTLSKRLCEEIKVANDLTKIPFPMPAKLIKKTLERRLKDKHPKLKIACVFPFSCHYLQLIDYLQVASINIDEIECVFMPPTSMAMSLQSGDIDGFCAGGPYNAKSVRNDTGVTVLTSYDIWQDRAEKVLAITQCEYDKTPEIFEHLCAALIEACQWLKEVPNRFEAARIMSSDQYLDTNIDIVAPSLLGSCLTEEGKSPRHLPHYNRFSSIFSAADEGPYAVNRPTFEQAEWLYGKLQHVWPHAFENKIAEQVMKQCFRPDIFANAILAHKKQINR